ncbi:hypothetical protein ABZ904_37360 [Streptomyces sp. NPDC046900]|uniref:hypothetical protein n=1 Tax=Streptomyces sp. NPDC046900 TaxID=3155473 RepID=UPI0033ED3715
MPESLEALEQRMADLRAALREATRAGDKGAASKARRELRAVEQAWNEALDAEADTALAEPDESAGRQRSDAVSAAVRASRSAGAVIPVREQVHQALTVLGANAAPKLISATHEAFFADTIVTTRLASLRRDEERSFAAQAYARPYYICAALTHDRLAPARGLLAVSTWPLEQRIVGPLGPRTDFLTQAVRVAEQIQRIQATGEQPSDAAWRLLHRFAQNVPGAHEGFGAPDPERVIRAATAEFEVHAEEDAAQRRAAAERARDLTDSQKLFGAPSLGLAGAADPTGTHGT